MTDERTYYLYRHFDAGDELLYVGISCSPLNRTAEHSRKAKWFREIKIIKIEMYETREAVAFAEKEAIKKEQPIYNIIYGGGITKKKALKQNVRSHRFVIPLSVAEIKAIGDAAWAKDLPMAVWAHPAEIAPGTGDRR